MENRRFILICVFGVLLFLIYQASQQEQAAPAGERSSTVDEMAEMPDGPAAADPDLPTAAAADTPDTPEAPAAPAAAGSAAAATDGSIRVETDVVRARIALQGGDLRHLALLDYPESEADPQPLPIIDDTRAKWSIVESGVL